jgi:ankyrin repeat protein
MKNGCKFYVFVKNLIKNNDTLSESIISGHKVIFENDEAIEEGLRNTIGKGIRKVINVGKDTVKYMADPDTGRSATPEEKFQMAIDNNDLNEVKRLVSGVNDAYTNWGFRRAAKIGHLDIVKLLINEKDANINIHDSDDGALQHAAIGGHLDVVKFLVEKGADINAGHGRALKWAAIAGHSDVVNFLADHGANLSYVLQRAIDDSDFDMVKFLIEKRINIYEPALRLAIRKNNPDMVDYIYQLRKIVNN